MEGGETVNLYKVILDKYLLDTVTKHVVAPDANAAIQKAERETSYRFITLEIIAREDNNGLLIVPPSAAVDKPAPKPTWPINDPPEPKPEPPPSSPNLMTPSDLADARKCVEESGRPWQGPRHITAQYLCKALGWSLARAKAVYEELDAEHAADRCCEVQG